MKEGWHDLEVVIDRLIPYMLILLLFIIIGEIFYSHELESYHFWIEIIDIFIILVFTFDLFFKYQRVRNIKLFLKKYWLDIIAIFPFFLVFRLFEEIGLINRIVGETTTSGQQILHGGLEVKESAVKVAEGVKKETKLLQGLEKEGAKIASEVEKSGKISRTEELARLIKPILRVLRALKYASDGTNIKLKKEIGAVEKGAEQDIAKIKKGIKKSEKVVEKEFKKGEHFVEKEIKKGEGFVKKEEKKASRVLNAFVFYERPTGKHHIHEQKE